MVRSASSRVSNHEATDFARGHPSRRRFAAPQDKESHCLGRALARKGLARCLKRIDYSIQLLRPEYDLDIAISSQRQRPSDGVARHADKHRSLISAVDIHEFDRSDIHSANPRPAALCRATRPTAARLTPTRSGGPGYSRSPSRAAWWLLPRPAPIRRPS